MEKKIPLNSVYKKRTKNGYVFVVADNLNPDIKLEVSASKESWKAFRHFFVENDAQFYQAFYQKFIIPGFVRSTVKLPRGSHANAWALEQKLNRVAPYSYSVIDYCLKNRNRVEWPHSVVNLVQEFNTERRSSKLSPRSPYNLTAFLMEQEYGDERRKIAERSKKKDLVAWTGDVEGFKKAYLVPHTDKIKVYQEYIRTILDNPSKSLLRDLELITDNPPLDFLFSPKHIFRLKSK